MLNKVMESLEESRIIVVHGQIRVYKMLELTMESFRCRWPNQTEESPDLVLRVNLINYRS